MKLKDDIMDILLSCKIQFLTRHPLPNVYREMNLSHIGIRLKYMKH